jgi:hypothetical protein
MDKRATSKVIIIISALMLCMGCNHSSDIKEKRLKDTLEALKKFSDFRPLNSADVYEFINRYYLPRLDTMPTKRKIFVYALNGLDFKEAFSRDKTKPEKEYSGDAIKKNGNITFALPPPPMLFDKKFSWDSKRLLNTKIVSDTAILIDQVNELKNYKIWHQKYGFGYVLISIPQYNPYTKRLIICESIEDAPGFCGACKLQRIWFTKIPGGWKAN